MSTTGPQYGRLQSYLSNSKLQTDNNAAYQTILGLITGVKALQNDLQGQITAIEAAQAAIADAATTILLRGLHADRPDPSQVPLDCLYYETDNELTFQNDGTSWVTYADTGAAGITELTGDVTAGPGTGSQAATIASHAVTFAKMQQIAAHNLLGRFNTSTGNIELLAIGTGLSDSGGTLSASGVTAADTIVNSFLLMGA